MKALIDGDVLVFRSCFGAEHRNYIVKYNGTEIKFENKKECNAYLKERNLTEEETVWTEHVIEPLSHSLSNIRNSINTIRERLQASEVKVYLSGKNNFRYRIATIRPYKGNRDPSHRPAHEKAAREYLTRYHGAVVTDGIEADDALGIEASKDPKNSTIATNDKDLKQISCWHYNWIKNEDPIYVTPKEAGLFFFQQVVSGDPTDNIEGIQGLGPQGAAKLLAEVGSVRAAEETLVTEYRRSYGPGEGDRRLLETARLVKIHTTEEERDNLWTPTYIKLALP